MGLFKVSVSVLNIIFSVLLLPVNLYCSFWIFKEALHLSGVTFKDFLADLNDKVPSSSGRSAMAKRRIMKRRQGIILSYLMQNSVDPQRTQKLFHAYLYCTLPGLLSILLAGYTAYSFRNPHRFEIAIIGNLLLLSFNVILVIVGRSYRRNNPLDEKTAYILAQKYAREKAEGEKHKVKNAIVYTIVGVFFLAFITCFFLATGRAMQPMQVPNQATSSITETVDYYKVSSVLSQREYETANIPTTYWFLDEDKLTHVASGRKDDVAFEFYEYSDATSTDGVYNRIVYDMTEEMEGNQQKKHESDLQGGGKIFTMTESGISTVALYQGNTVVYAYSPEGSTEIEIILEELGYWE